MCFLISLLDFEISLPSIKMLDVPERYKSFLFKSILISSESPLKIFFLAKLIGFPDTEINSSDKETSFPEKVRSLFLLLVIYFEYFQIQIF